MSETITEEQVEVPSMTSMTAQDRCDGCSAQAYVRVSVHGTQLMFCGHHYAKGEVTLATQGAKVLEDNRAALTARPTNANAV